MRRFIQFNDELVDANELLSYDYLAKALSGANVDVTERQLMEIQIAEKKIAMSVFWRHRDPEVIRAGRLTDIYLLTLGFWREFRLREWQEANADYDGTSPKLFEQLILLLEELRFMERIERERKGTRKKFQIRRDTMIEHHKKRLTVNLERGRLADAIFHQCVLYGMEGTLAQSPFPTKYPMERIARLMESVYSLRSTSDSIDVASGIMYALQPVLRRDLVYSYYAFEQFLKEEAFTPFHYHEGMKESELGQEGEKETIEEVYRTWHRESEDESGLHLQYELEHGAKGRSLSDEATAGSPEATIDHIREGESDASAEQVQEGEELATGSSSQQAGHTFGNANRHVVYEEVLAEQKKIDESKLKEWLLVQTPLVQRFKREMNERMEKKKTAERTGLTYGRLSKKAILQLWTEERPKLFYKKTNPGKPIDAAFGLLIDQSASMHDKLEETKRAVLLFHTVLRELAVRHAIAGYSEDSITASKEAQYNTFELFHRFQDGTRNSDRIIASMEAHDDNRDGFAIRWMTEALKREQVTHRFLLVFSDGEPSAFEYGQNGIVDTREAVIEARRAGIIVLHLFLNDTEPTEDQLHTFQMMFDNQSVATSDVTQFTEQTLRLLRKMFAIVFKGLV